MFDIIEQDIFGQAIEVRDSNSTMWWKGEKKRLNSN